MDREALIDLLNQDLADEHISVIRYLIHAYQAGEDTSLGSMMLSIAREEMWHMDYLADEIGEMGAEPNMIPGVYPHDPTSNASLLRSYIDWEDNLVKEYMAQAAKVDKADIKKILMQQSKESAIHSQRFAAMLGKLGPEGEEPLVYEDTGAFSPEMTERLETEMADEYQLVLQHLRHAFVFEDESCPVSSELELTAMRHMKHLSHFAEELAESGHELEFDPPAIDQSRSVEPALESDLELTHAARARFAELSQHPELSEHRGLKTELENMIYQEEFLASNVEGLLGEVDEPASESKPEVGEAAEEAPEATHEPPDTGVADGFTVGSLIVD
jgi:bacterioferritin (cytochrome b1)